MSQVDLNTASGAGEPAVGGAENVAIETRGLTVQFGGVRALYNVDTRFAAGRVTGIIGPNGAGKTTFINVISGLVPASDGQVLCHGRNITDLPAHRRAQVIGRTFQTCQLVEELDVVGNILVGRTSLMKHGLTRSILPWGMSRREESTGRTRALELMDLVGLGDSRDRPIKALTLVEQRLVEIARALALEPRVLVLDEPTAGLSYAEKQTVSALIREIEDSMNITQLLIEHDMRFVTDVCIELLALNFGEVLAFGPARSVLENPHLAEAYLGK